MSEKSTEDGLPQIGKSVNVYFPPFHPGLSPKQYLDSPAHTGPFRGAIDYAVPLGTDVLAPFSGVVHEVADNNDKFGPTEDFAEFANYITIEHGGSGEFSQVVHLAKGSAKVKKGDKVDAEQPIALTGNSGWMTEPHLHFFVYKNVDTDDGFIGLEPQFIPQN